MTEKHSGDYPYFCTQAEEYSGDNTDFCSHPKKRPGGTLCVHTSTVERPGGKANVYTHPGKETTGRQLLRPHSPKRFWNSFSNSLTNTDSRTSPEPKDAIISDILAHSSCSSKGLRMDRHWLLSMPDPETVPLPPLREHEAGGLLVTASSPSSNFPAEPFVPDVIS
jgi:hypothetical protein